MALRRVIDVAHGFAVPPCAFGARSRFSMHRVRDGITVSDKTLQLSCKAARQSRAPRRT